MFIYHYKKSRSHLKIFLFTKDKVGTGARVRSIDLITKKSAQRTGTIFKDDIKPVVGHDSIDSKFGLTVRIA